MVFSLKSSLELGKVRHVESTYRLSSKRGSMFNDINDALRLRHKFSFETLEEISKEFKISNESPFSQPPVLKGVNVCSQSRSWKLRLWK